MVIKYCREAIPMSDPRVEKLSHTLIHYSVAIHPGDTIAILGDTSGLPLIEETYKAALLAGGHPVVVLNSDAIVGADGSLANFFLQHANDEQLKWISPVERWVVEESKVRITIRSSSNTRRNSSVDPKRISAHNGSRSQLSKIRFARAASGEQRLSLVQFPSEAYAPEAALSLGEF